MQPLDGRPYRQLTHSPKDLIFRLVFSPDGTDLAIERGALESDAVLFHDTSQQQRRSAARRRLHYHQSAAITEFALADSHAHLKITSKEWEAFLDDYQ